MNTISLSQSFKQRLTKPMALLTLLFAVSTSGIANAHPHKTPFIEIYDDAALQLLNPSAPIQSLGKGYSWSEGPLWIEEGEFLLFSDVPQNIIYRYKEGEGVSPYLAPSGATGIAPGDSTQGGNGLLLNEKGQLVIMQHGDRRVAIMDAPLTKPKTNFTTVVDKYDGKRFNSPNDGVFHSNGDLYFTDPPYGLKEQREDPNKALDFDGIYLLKADGKLILADQSVLYPNGVVLSTDESALIVAASDSNKASWYKYDLDEDGALLNKRVFYDASDLVGKDGEAGLPDGMVVHSSGHVFATGPGGVFLFTEDGKLLAKIRTGKATANATLSGDESTLFMTAHDTLMSVELK